MEGLLGCGYHLSHRKVRSLLDQVLGVEISTGAINTIRCRLSESLATLVEEAVTSIRHEKVAHMDETGVLLCRWDNPSLPVREV